MSKIKKYQEILNRWSVKIDFETILAQWNSNKRYYHNSTHLYDILDNIEKDKEKYTIFQYDELVLTAIFHDIIYDVSLADNEKRSADFFLDYVENRSGRMVSKVYQNIIDTKDHDASSEISEAFIAYDMDILNRPVSELMRWEKAIRKEYSIYTDSEYKEGRLHFLKSIIKKYRNPGLLKVIKFVSNS